jgi:hypothetical protein
MYTVVPSLPPRVTDVSQSRAPMEIRRATVRVIVRTDRPVWAASSFRVSLQRSSLEYTWERMIEATADSLTPPPASTICFVQPWRIGVSLMVPSCVLSPA